MNPCKGSNTGISESTLARAKHKGREISLHGPLNDDISSQANKKAVGSDAHGLDS